MGEADDCGDTQRAVGVATAERRCRQATWPACSSRNGKIENYAVSSPGWRRKPGSPRRRVQLAEEGSVTLPEALGVRRPADGLLWPGHLAALVYLMSAFENGALPASSTAAVRARRDRCRHPPWRTVARRTGHSLMSGSSWIIWGRTAISRSRKPVASTGSSPGRSCGRSSRRHDRHARTCACWLRCGLVAGTPHTSGRCCAKRSEAAIPLFSGGSWTRLWLGTFTPELREAIGLARAPLDLVNGAVEASATAGPRAGGADRGATTPSRIERTQAAGRVDGERVADRDDRQVHAEGATPGRGAVQAASAAGREGGQVSSTAEHHRPSVPCELRAGEVRAPARRSTDPAAQPSRRSPGTRSKEPMRISPITSSGGIRASRSGTPRSTASPSTGWIRSA